MHVYVYKCPVLKYFRKANAQRKSHILCFKITNRFCYFQSNYKNSEILTITFKTTSTNVLNRADMWPNLELFIYSHMKTFQLVKISSIRQSQTPPHPQLVLLFQGIVHAKIKNTDLPSLSFPSLHLLAPLSPSLKV